MKKHCKRKVWALVNPITHAMEGASVAPKSRLDELRMLELSATEAFAKGRATLRDFESIVSMLNLCQHMAQTGIGPEALEACARAEDAAKDAAGRMERTGKLGLTGPGLQAFRDVFAFHDLQRTAITLGQYEAAIKKTIARLRSHAPGTIEL